MIIVNNIDICLNRKVNSINPEIEKGRLITMLYQVSLNYPNTKDTNNNGK